MKLVKFGGSSLGTAGRIVHAVSIISEQQKQESLVVVCSAVGGITNKLLTAAEKAKAGDTAFKDLFKDISLTHIDLVKEIIPVQKQSSVLAELKVLLNELEDVLTGIFLVGELSLRVYDRVLSFGELLSCYIVAQVLEVKGIAAQFCDARQLIRTNSNYGNAEVDFPLTNALIGNYFSSQKKLQVVTGFIASDELGNTTTLGRSGSDYTASIIGAALQVSEIQIWTDVNGILSADPRIVSHAVSLDQISYDEATELSHFGAKVIFPATMLPAKLMHIPIRVLNSFNPEFPGTLIAEGDDIKKRLVCGIASLNKISLINLQGSGLQGAVGFSQKVFSALAQQSVNVILISQASSEYTLCIAVREADAVRAVKALQEVFAFELQCGKLDKIFCKENFCVVAIVGSNMAQTPGIAGKMFHVLGSNNINVCAIAQGSSERNISAVIRLEDEAKAINVLHDSFFLSDSITLNVFVIGTGNVGSVFLDILKSNSEKIRISEGISIKVVGLANSRKMIFSRQGINLNAWKADLFEQGETMSMTGFFSGMQELNLPNSIVLDCTAGESVVAYYRKFFELRYSVVTPNKRANSGTQEQYLALKQDAKKYGVGFFYETNVGAALPVLSTLYDLKRSGDTVLKIEAVLSGTLSFIFNSFTADKKFSDVVKDAMTRGYTEPDVRDDLSGMDVARKLLILIRESGYVMEMADIKLQPVIPQEISHEHLSENDLEWLRYYDNYFDERLQLAQANGNKLCYIAQLEKGTARVSLKEVGRNHPFYNLSGTDNIISFTTNRYSECPLVIRGPGAGAEVTAAGVFTDLMRVVSNLN